MLTTKGSLKPIRDHVLITDMEFDEVRTTTGIFIPSQNGKSSGIKPRWGKVYAVGPEQQDIKVGEWILVEHGRWTRGVTLETDTGDQYVVRRVDNDAVMLIADEKPNDIFFNDL